MATASLDIARPDPHAPPPIAAAAPARPSLAGLTRAELTARLAAIGVPERERKMRAAQLWHWIYFRGTLCVSSQVGCTLTCSFCHTGTQRLVRNLTAQEIAAQAIVARDRLGDW